MKNLLRILVVEDNPGDTALLEHMLNESGVRFELQCAERLSAAIEQLKTNSFDVILLDLGLPDSYGLDTLIRLNSIETTAPIIVLTGLVNEAVGSEAVKAGAQDYLIKGQIDKNLLTRSISHSIERKRSAETIQTAAREWLASFDAMADGVSIHTLDHTIIKVNQALLQLLGKKENEVVGKKCYQLFHGAKGPTENCTLCKTRDTKLKAYAEIFEPTLNKWLAVSTSPIIDSSGNLPRIVHTVRDITEHRKLEEQLRQSQKMESIGTLAGGIAHDFNNILTAIVGYGNLALMKMADDDAQRLYIQNMLDAADRAAHLTKDLLLFSRKQTSDKKPVNLNEVVAKVEKFLIKVIAEDIHYKTNIHEVPLPVLADQHQLEQVLLNLATNAGHAMPKGGELTVTTGIATLDGESVSVNGYGRTDSYALITVADTGKGMDETTRQRVFEPFFTTKDVGKGTGLGLAVVYGIIKQHDGSINVFSEQGKGSVFKIYLPLIAPANLADRREPQKEAVVGGTETILLAEDDDMVRRLANKVLTEYGYKVIEVVDGANAVSVFMENSQTIDLLLFDIIMPNMNGKLAYDEIRKARPGIKAIFSSGYTSEIIQQKVALADGAHLLTKPVAPHELLRKVRDVLDGI